MRSVLFALSSLFLGPGMAAAADVRQPAAAAPLASWFGYAEGGYVFRSNTGTREFGLEDGRTYDRARTGGGGYGAAKFGYRIDDAWDVAAGFRYLSQSTGRISDDRYGWQFTGGHDWNVDAEVGYRSQQGDWSLRPFAGLRYQHYSADFRDNSGEPIFTANEATWGLGPLVGIDVSKPIGDRLSFFASADAAVLFGKVKVERNYNSFVPEEFSHTRTFAAVDLKAGLAWEFAPGVKLGAGYQFRYLSGVGYETFYDEANYLPAGKASQLTHGPFARISFNY